MKWPRRRPARGQHARDPVSRLLTGVGPGDLSDLLGDPRFRPEPEPYDAWVNRRIRLAFVQWMHGSGLAAPNIATYDWQAMLDAFTAGYYLLRDEGLDQ